MASPEQISALRLMINQPDDVEPYTDEALGALIDLASGDLNGVAYDIWTTKAASVVNLVDISEGGSSRKMGDLHEQYLAMASVFAGRSDASVARTGTRVSRIRR